MLHKSRGFTTIELAIVIIVFGLVTTTVMLAFGLYNKQKIASDTKQALEISRQAMDEFRSMYGAYPCPADPTLTPGHADYGRESRAPGCIFPDMTCACQEIPGKVRRVDGEDTAVDTNTNADPVFVGAVPFATLVDPDRNPGGGFRGVMFTPITDSTSSDGWSHKLTYEVSGNLAESDQYNARYGAIDIVDEFGNSLTDTGKFAHLALISHGENGRGSYTREGIAVENCPATLPAPDPSDVATPVSEIENCNTTATVLDGLRNEKNHSYNDDVVTFLFSESADLWGYGTDITQIHNLNPGYVGIGTNDPRERLEVKGDITAFETQARTFCDVTGNEADCMPPETIGGDGLNNASMQCPPGEVVTKIENNAVDCDPPFSTLITNVTCQTAPDGTQFLLKGVSTANGPECCDPRNTNPDATKNCNYTPP